MNSCSFHYFTGCVALLFTFPLLPLIPTTVSNSSPSISQVYISQASSQAPREASRLKSRVSPLLCQSIQGGFPETRSELFSLRASEKGCQSVAHWWQFVQWAGGLLTKLVMIPNRSFPPSILNSPKVGRDAPLLH